MNKNDLRVIKTKTTLYNTLKELMQEKTFEEIKVSDICSKALINRSTFYAHYNDKYELLAAFIAELKKSLTDELNKNTNISNTKEYYLEMIKLFLSHIEEKRETYLAIMLNNRSSITMDIIYDVLDHDITTKLQEKKYPAQNIPSNIIVKFYLGGVINVGLVWLKNKNLYTKEELIEYFDHLIPNNLNF